MNRKSRLVITVRAALTGAALLLFPTFARAAEEVAADQSLPARPGDFSLKVEPGIAVPLSPPQSQLFQVGGSETIKGLFSLSRYFDLGPSGSFMTLTPQSNPGIAGTAWTLGGSLQLKRPHDVPDRDAMGSVSPWIDVDALYVRTGVLDRFGYAVAAGLAVPIGRSRVFWLGPFVRYFQILQPNKAGNDNSDANILSLGISLEVGGVRRERVVTAAPVTIVKEPFTCPDRAHDGVPDSIDLCPDVPGPAENYGCPVYKKVVVKPGKLELKEKIQFAWDQTTLEVVSYPVLDEVVQALNDNKGFRVQVEGNTSSEGTETHNQTLSEGRAKAVLDYLVAHGISAERLGSKGFASTVPIATNKTEVGREANRRVEFIVHFKILDHGSK